MHDGLHRADSRHPPVEAVVRAEAPSRQPHEQVVAHAEEPDEREVHQREDARAVRDVAQELAAVGGPVEVPVREAVVYGADEDVERDEGGDGEGLEARRERAPAEGLGAAVVEEGWGGEVALYESG